ncbi:MAG TPA: radical SAM protein [Burkholderiales bacterium]|nr:radical SAM protein [Burkholderiales bacterium]
MRVALVHPAGYNFCPGQPDLTLFANRMAPIGILSLASWLDKHGHETMLLDCLGPRAPKTTEETVQRILAFKPDLVGFSTTTSAFLDGYDIASQIKQKHPEIKTIFGAVHPSSIGGQLLEYFPNADYLCVGEGEGTLVDLADGKALRDVPNLVYRDGDNIVSNPRRARINDLDELPFPAWDKLDGFASGYHLPLFSYIKRYGTNMITSRGCPFTCSFCDRTVYEHKYRHNSAEYTWEHMKLLRDRYGVHHINFYDDLFTASRKRVVELCETLIRKPLGMDWSCAIRVGHNDDEELFALMKRAGALQLSMGIETADPGMMERHKTGLEPDMVRATVGRIQKLGMRVKGLFIMGLPGETPESFRKTSDFVLDLDLDEMNMTKFTPFHGAPMWHEIIANNGKDGNFHEDWRLMNCLNFVYIPEGFQSREQMEDLYNWHILRFYKSKNYERRFRKRLWQHRWTLWHIVKHLPTLLRAKTHFTHEGVSVATQLEMIPLHPAQPTVPLAAGTTSNTAFANVPEQYLPEDKKVIPVKLRARPDKPDRRAA